MFIEYSWYDPKNHSLIHNWCTIDTECRIFIYTYMVHFQDQFPNVSDSNPSCHFQLHFNFIYLIGLASCRLSNLSK